MGVFDMLNVSASALMAERQRAEITTANMANAETTHTVAGGPYKRKEVVFSSQGRSSFRLMFAGYHASASNQVAGAVRVSQVVEDPTPPVRRYDPGHPDADKDGYVSLPNINPVQEMVDLMGATRAYQLNASAVSAAKQMIQQSIDILKS